MEAQLRELIPFLRDRNPQVRQIALEHLLPHTPPGASHRNIFFQGLGGGGLQAKPRESDVVRDLKLLCRDQLNIAHDAFRALVNLSDSPLLLSSLSDHAFLEFLVSYIIHPPSILADLASMLLSNLTATAPACAALLSLRIPILPSTSPSKLYPTQSRCATSPAPTPYPPGEVRQARALPFLLDAFAHAETNPDLAQRTRKADLHFLASVFANLSVAPAGRAFFLTPRPAGLLAPEDPDLDSSVVSAALTDGKEQDDEGHGEVEAETEAEYEYPLAKIVSFTEHKDTIRRGGVAATIKNCAFHAPGHRAMLALESERLPIAITSARSSTDTRPRTRKAWAAGIDVLPYILLPLAGPEEFDLEESDALPPALQLLPPTKTREPDPALRLTHVETLLLLCHTRAGRDALRARGVYFVVREAHLCEGVDKISEHIERLVTLLQGEEPADAREAEELARAETIVDAAVGAPGGSVSASAVAGLQQVPGQNLNEKVAPEVDEDEVIEEV
ncbi:hypothetical protein H0H81_010411 [Sphagnurus paluster]|uniref:Protein HGH1 homolog n=1 Tax=Sphagnurus paluster TaxID=117069 RepID=A0A9P7KJQ6_9AGAR|nr:hypothetical protein H0H81_010411 [Sphagnurus paluster]